jgi:hypothetical protein
MTDGNGERRAGRHTPAFDLTVLPEPAFAGAAKTFLNDPLRDEIMPHVGDREAYAIGLGHTQTREPACGSLSSAIPETAPETTPETVPNLDRTGLTLGSCRLQPPASLDTSLLVLHAANILCQL